MGDPLHVLHVVRQSMQWEKADHAKYFHGRLLLSDEFSFHLFEPKLACDINDLRDKRLGEAAPAELRMHHHADATDVAFPAAELLVQGGDGENLAVMDGQQWKVPAQVDVLTLVVDHCGVGDAMFDEHPLARGHGEEEFVERHLVRALERAQHTQEAAREFEFLRVFSDDHFQ